MENRMRLSSILISLGALFATACSSAEWVNLNNSRADYATDFNKCEMQAYNDPKFQGGMKIYVEEYRDRCMAKLGWRLREKRD
jgi:outer membrane biogenesis lipoprotein LolB